MIKCLTLNFYFKETIVKLIDMLKLDTHLDRSKKASMDENYHRNIAIVLGCIAEKLAGPRSIALFTTSTLEYLISNLVNNHKYLFSNISVFFI